MRETFPWVRSAPGGAWPFGITGMRCLVISVAAACLGAQDPGQSAPAPFLPVREHEALKLHHGVWSLDWRVRGDTDGPDHAEWFSRSGRERVEPVCNGLFQCVERILLTCAGIPNGLLGCECRMSSELGGIQIWCSGVLPNDPSLLSLSLTVACSEPESEVGSFQLLCQR
jgi:hypothetical protein